ncbi:TPA: DUF1642 domain-containing protein [Streptococcus suis]|nr:DUF1642 domain-containing protein [Streptococcus suis]
MNKQEEIEKIKNIDTLSINDMIAGQSVDMVIKNQVIDLISQIHEPQKVVVPKNVAEWLRKYQQDLTLLKVLDAAENELIVPSAVNNWILDNQRDFVVAWHDGFEIEREQLFTVEIPDPNRKGTNRIYLGKSNPDSKVIIHKGNFNPKKNKNLWLTEEEIKKDFAWAWQFAKEVE